MQDCANTNKYIDQSISFMRLCLIESKINFTSNKKCSLSVRVDCKASTISVVQNISSTNRT